MISVYWVDIKEITENLILKYRASLAPSEAERYQKMTHKTRQLQFLIGRRLIWAKCHQSPRLLENGKPIVQGGYISLSHSEDIVALAVSENPIGLDIEKMVPRSDFENIAARLQFQLSADKAASFYEGFTRFEATYKLGDTKRPCISYAQIENYKVCIASTIVDEPVKILKENPAYL